MYCMYYCWCWAALHCFRTVCWGDKRPLRIPWSNRHWPETLWSWPGLRLCTTQGCHQSSTVLQKHHGRHCIDLPELKKLNPKVIIINTKLRLLQIFTIIHLNPKMFNYIFAFTKSPKISANQPNYACSLHPWELIYKIIWDSRWLNKISLHPWYKAKNSTLD